MKTEHESTTQKHGAKSTWKTSIRRILLKTNLQLAKKENTMW